MVTGDDSEGPNWVLGDELDNEEDWKVAPEGETP